MSYRTNEKIESIISLEFVSEQSDLVTKDVFKWKWILIGLHNALQNFMVCTLRGSENTNVLADKSALQWLEEFWNRMNDKQHKWKYPKERLDSFTKLFEKIQTDKMKKGIFSKKFEPTPSQIASVIDLNFFRNELIHFVPRNWSLSINGLPQLVLEVISIIEFLAFESKNIVWSEENEKTRMRNALNNIKNNFNTSNAT